MSKLKLPILSIGFSVVLISSLLLTGRDCYAGAPKPQIVVYPAPAGEKLSDVYHVYVSGKTVPVYMAKVAAKDRDKRFKAIVEMHHPADYCDTAAFAYFDMKGTVEVNVKFSGNVASARVLPLSASIGVKLQQHSVSFKLTEPKNITLEINGEYVKSLHLFVNPIENNAPDPHDPNVIFFGPGIHQVSHLAVGDNKTVYVAGGAIVRAIVDPAEPFSLNKKDSSKSYSPTFDLRGKNITFRGRGIIDAGACFTHTRNLFLLKGSNLKMEGVILRDPATWTVPIRQSDSVVIDNIKILGYRANSDGIDICNSRNVAVKNCFVRTSDDLVVLKTDKGQGIGKNITIENCVLWNQVAHALSIGAEIREPISQVLFTNCDIIHDQGREWSLRIYQCDSALVSHVCFDNIRIEEAKRCISVWIGKAVWSRDKEYGHIQDVSFKNIKATGQPVSVELTGADEQHGIDKVTFQQVTLKGKPITLPDIKANSFARNIVIAAQ